MSAVSSRAAAATTAPIGPRVLRVAPAPHPEPPAHGPDWGGRLGSGTTSWSEAQGDVRYVQGALAVDLREDGTDPLFGPQATRSADLPDPEPWTRQVLQAALEVVEGVRPAAQLSRWVTPAIREELSRRGTLARRRGRRAMPRPRIRVLRVSSPADGVLEASAVVHLDGRVRAVALRLSGVDGRWLVTAWEQG